MCEPVQGIATATANAVATATNRSESSPAPLPVTLWSPERREWWTRFYGRDEVRHALRDLATDLTTLPHGGTSHPMKPIDARCDLVAALNTLALRDRQLLIYTLALGYTAAEAGEIVWGRGSPYAAKTVQKQCELALTRLVDAMNDHRVDPLTAERALLDDVQPGLADEVYPPEPTPLSYARRWRRGRALVEGTFVSLTPPPPAFGTVPAWPVYDPALDSPLVALAALWQMCLHGHWKHLAEFGITKEQHGPALDAARRALGGRWPRLLVAGPSGLTLERIARVTAACPDLLEAMAVLLAAYHERTHHSLRARLRAIGDPLGTVSASPPQARHSRHPRASTVETRVAP